MCSSLENGGRRGVQMRAMMSISLFSANKITWNGSKPASRWRLPIAGPRTPAGGSFSQDRQTISGSLCAHLMQVLASLTTGPTLRCTPGA